MSVTYPIGFRAAGVACGLKESGARDLALVENIGRHPASAGVLTSNRVQAAPVSWTRAALGATVKAVVLNSGGANACTGPDGYADTVETAHHVAATLGIEPNEVAVCSTGLIGVRLDLPKILTGVDRAAAELGDDAGCAANAADAIRTTDTRPKVAVADGAGYRIGGMAKGAGMLAPGLATMLVVLTTDAQLPNDQLQIALRQATALSFDRIDSDGCMSTNDTVLLLASGESGTTPATSEFTEVLGDVCHRLAMELIGDAEGATKDIEIICRGAASVDDALTAGRAVARSNLLKCAIYGQDPNWGRVLSAIGTTDAAFDPGQIDVSFNGVMVARAGAIGEPRELVDLGGRAVQILIDLHAGSDEATIWTNDLSVAYVHENSAYSS